MQHPPLHSLLLTHCRVVRVRVHALSLSIPCSLVPYIPQNKMSDSVPSWFEFMTAWKEAVRDVMVACRSVAIVVGLVLRPAASLLRQGLPYVLQHALYMVQQALYFQSRLTRRQALWEGTGILALLAIHVIRRQWQKHQYVSRATRWVRTKQHRLYKLYRVWQNRVSQTSLLLAMLLPHALFGAVLLVCWTLFPHVFIYLARDTHLLWVIAVAYPWIRTVAILQPTTQTTKTTTTTSTNTTVTRTTGTVNTDDTNTTDSTDKRRKTKKRRTSSSTPSTTPSALILFPRTSPTAPNTFTTLQPSHSDDDKDDKDWWVHYWLIHAVLTALSKLVLWTPLLGTLVKNSFRSQIAQLQLILYMWIYGLEWALQSTASCHADLASIPQLRPVSFLHRNILPILQRIVNTISEKMCSFQQWQDYVVPHVQALLHMASWMRLLSKPDPQWIQRAHLLVMPTLTLIVPGTTRYGLLYVQTLLPAATLQQQTALHYWTTAILVQNILLCFHGILRYIPFSTHALLILWCGLYLGSEQTHSLLQHELQALGLLPQTTHNNNNNNSVPLTARMVQRVLRSLPSANENDEPTKRIVPTETKSRQKRQDISAG